MTGAGSCLPCRKHHHDGLFRQGHNRLGGNGNMQNLHSWCLCCSLLVNQLSETANLALLTGPSIHKAFSPQIDLWSLELRNGLAMYAFIFLFIYLACFPRHVAAALSLPASSAGFVWVQPRRGVTGSHCHRAPSFLPSSWQGAPPCFPTASLLGFLCNLCGSSLWRRIEPSTHKISVSRALR